MRRRQFAKVLVGAGAVATGGIAFSSFAGQAQVGSAIRTNDTQIANDRGDLAAVTVDPTATFEWSNFDQAVGEVTFAIRARGPNQETFRPVFVTSPWLIPDSENGSYDRPARINGWRPGGDPPLTYTKPGTTGSIQFRKPLSRVLQASADSRGETNPIPNGVTVVSDDAPDYDSFVEDGVVSRETMDNYLDLESVGETPETLRSAGASLENGTYGAAADTDAFDNGADASTVTTEFDVEWVVYLRRPGLAQLYLMTPNLEYGEYVGVYDGSAESGGPGRIGAVADYDELEAAVRDDLEDRVEFGSGWLENVRPSDVALEFDIVGSPSPPAVQSFDQTQLTLPMGGDEYAEPETPTSRAFSDLRPLAEGHPAIIFDDDDVAVDVTNERSTPSPEGESNTGAQGAGQ